MFKARSYSIYIRAIAKITVYLSAPILQCLILVYCPDTLTERGSNMKDTLMRVTLSEGIEVKVWHSSAMVDLTTLWKDACRVSERVTIPSMHKWLSSTRTKILISEYEDLNDVTEGELVYIKGTGRNAKTWAHIDLVVSAMAFIDPKIEAAVTHEFVNNRVLAWRDDSGEQFKDLNALIAFKAISVLGKPSHRGHYIAIAKSIKTRCEVADWNLSSASQLKERTRIETALTVLLENDVVTDWEHLKELANKV